MGYRSDVVLVVGKEAMPHFMAIVSTVPEGLSLCFQDHDLMEQDYYNEKGTILFHWSGVKWYGGAGIEAIESFLLKMADLAEMDYDEWGHTYRFVRMGEDSSDEDAEGYGYGDVHVSRSLNF
jgi:hypothetical protein